ncbi:RagB/SusD family nutrient uptake outer membrane protein [Sphingobacterium sp. SRCM116780]|uniref:RagB/SusD family nutrient uptake outer membrane protein n=1 Tax=Sphingobacterium sp. SRCM116780 TaxID=2907623 RepID=UPI001F311A66|nr:RagB/SusD family nutrient uptake outer membrane protein [Sphingobacterium sp. SRCM116780]UIR56578.1 RagB/SusD family nutrient uptake outer membrane protein [Sphingobacterium sp. SRCM116780]
MKKLFIASCILISLSVSSCKDFLDVKPTNSGDAETAIQTAADAKVMINGLMSILSNRDYYGRNFPLYADVKGGDFTIFAAGRGFDYLYTFNHSASSNSYSDVWAKGFNGITQINNLLKSIDNLKAAGSLENFSSYEGQALTARALINFDLVRLYGEPYNENKAAWGIPNITTPLSPGAQELRSKVEDNYKQILIDLKAAETLLPKTKLNGYLNYYANKALQARVYLYMEDYPNALTAAQEIIDSKVYTLYSNAAWVDSWKSEFGTESIFELGVYPNESDLGNSSLGAYFRRSGHGSSAILGNFMASDYFLNRLKQDAADVRWGVMARDETSATRLGAIYKYSGGVNLEGDKKTSNSTAVNFKVIRLSEVYLMAAEAALKSDKALAATYLNEIRKRSPNLAAADAATINLDMIADERSKELAGEGHRFFDMIRWNKTIVFNDEFGAINTIHRTKTIDRTFNKTILPIFLDEINANPGIGAQQNPGY